MKVSELQFSLIRPRRCQFARHILRPLMAIYTIYACLGLPLLFFCCVFLIIGKSTVFDYCFRLKP